MSGISIMNKTILITSKEDTHTSVTNQKARDLSTGGQAGNHACCGLSTFMLCFPNCTNGETVRSVSEGFPLKRSE